MGIFDPDDEWEVEVEVARVGQAVSDLILAKLQQRSDASKAYNYTHIKAIEDMKKRFYAQEYAESVLKVSLDPGAREPARAHPEDAGLDLFSPEAVKVPARGSAVIDTGVHVEIQNGYAGMIKSKSGLNIKHGIISDGVVDAGYTGSIRVKLYNLSDEDYMVELGDKISQLVIVPVVTPSVDIVGEIGGSERGNGGFGSTGR